jgi:hypothetical protein
MVKKVKQVTNKQSISKTSFDIPSPLKTAFKLKAVEDGESMGEVIIKLMQAYVNKKIKLDEI